MKKILLGSLLFLSLVAMPVTQVLAVQTTDPVDTPTPTQFEPLQSQENNINNLGDLFGLLKGFLFAVIGLVVGALILYSGFLYMTAAGEPDQIKKAQSIILYTLIGVAVIALSVIIVRIVAGILGIDISFLF